jgi:hypothetical protein
LRNLGPGEDACDLAIKKELEKGPKRIRVASREELKIDISKFKNIALKLIDLLKANKIPIPPGLKVDGRSDIRVGMKEEKKQVDIINADLESVAGSVADSMGSDMYMNEEAQKVKERYAP